MEVLTDFLVISLQNRIVTEVTLKISGSELYSFMVAHNEVAMVLV